MPPGGSAAASSAASRLAKIAPKTATPTEPPTWRNSVDPEVATPSSSYGTAFWAASTSTCIVIPSPSPSTSMYSSVCQVGIETLSPVSSAIARVMSAVPAIGNGL